MAMAAAEAAAAEDAIRALEATGEVRVLRRLAVAEGLTGVAGDIAGTSVGVVVDCETTGLDVIADDVIELAMRRFRYDRAGRIMKIDRARSWREDPGRPLSAEVARLTRLTDADLAGRTIDDRVAVATLRSARCVIAHNASFDRKMVERRLPAAAGLAWACTCREVDWAAGGFDGRALGWLLAQAGLFHEGHRAEADVDAVIALLRHAMPDGRTVLEELIDTASAPTVLVRAVGAHIDVKDALRSRGYRWNAGEAVWSREIVESLLTEEQFWLAANVYRSELRPRAAGPDIVAVTWFERHG